MLRIGIEEAPILYLSNIKVELEHFLHLAPGSGVVGGGEWRVTAMMCGQTLGGLTEDSVGQSNSVLYTTNTSSPSLPTLTILVSKIKPMTKL